MVSEIEEQVRLLSQLVHGLYDVLNSLSERLTGEEFTVYTGRGGEFLSIEPQVTRVRWRQSSVPGTVSGRGSDLAGSSTQRLSEPCRVRSANYRMPEEPAWSEMGLGPHLSTLERHEAPEAIAS